MQNLAGKKDEASEASEASEAREAAAQFIDLSSGLSGLSFFTFLPILRLLAGSSRWPEGTALTLEMQRRKLRSEAVRLGRRKQDSMST